MALVAVLSVGGLAVAADLPGIPSQFRPYRSWHRLNAKPLRPSAATAHPGRRNVYASRTRLPGGRFPYGTLIVKEGFAAAGGRRFVSLIATMRKARGADPSHGDWVFVEWARTSPRGRFREVAQGGVCFGCHVRALTTDWVFTSP